MGVIRRLRAVLFITRYFLKVDHGFVERRMQIGPGAEPSNTQQAVQLMSGVLACALLLSAGFDHRLQGSDLPAREISPDTLSLVIGTRSG